MLICHLNIQNFRGIKKLDWHPNGRTICLIGPNDSTKTTILDAIEVALAPRVNVPFTDDDFYMGDITKEIVIEVTIGDLPEGIFIDPEKFGLYLRGYVQGRGLKDDPDDACAHVITVRLKVDQTLEPEWTVVKESQEPKGLGWKDRETLGLVRIDENADRHLTWGRNSALSRMAGATSGTNQAFIEIGRIAKKIIAETRIEQLTGAASAAQTSAKLLGANFADLKPGLDILNLALGNSVLGLHEADIPVRLWV